MNNKSAFSLLLSEKKRDNEPSLTKVFAYILENDHNFCKFFMEKAYKLIIKEEIVQVTSEKKINESSRLDIHIELVNKFEIIIENKLYAKINKKQIEKYKKINSNIYLIYKVYNKEDFKPKEEPKSCSWFAIYNIANEYKEKIQNDEKKFLLDHFILFLEELNINIVRINGNINNEIITKKYESEQLKHLFNQILEALNYILKIQTISDYVVASPNSPEYYIYSIYPKENNKFFNLLISYINNDELQILTYYYVPERNIKKFDESEKLQEKFKQFYIQKKWQSPEKINGKSLTAYLLAKMDMSIYYNLNTVEDQIQQIKAFIQNSINKFSKLKNTL